MKEPLVSVMMITYNHAPFIAQAIQGVLHQKVNFPLELVIGEDCSTDGTREIVLEYQKKFPDIIRGITSDKNVGGRKNAHRTGKECRGKYIAYCEGDDYWHHPSKLQKQADYLESHPECGLVYSSYDVYHVRAKKLIKDFIKYRKWEMPQNLSLPDIVEGKDEKGVGILTCTVMVRKTLRDRVREADPYLYQNEKFLMGDTQLWAEIATMADLHYIPESLATHNITDESATRSKDIKKVLRFGISRAELGIYLCNKYNLPSSIRNYFEADWCDSSLILAFHSRNSELADEVRRKKKTFTWKEWLRYYGAKHLAIYHICRVAALFLALFRKEHKQWL
jgi:glycosyltransferase involved in cell wall biosynthesis